MRGLLVVAVALAGLPGVALAQGASGSMHRFEFVSIVGEPLPMSNFAGQAVLIVNTASRCGFTYQYGALQNLWEAYRDRGLLVLGVPSNDFGGQEPGTEEQIKEFCEVNFDVDFPLTEKQVVKGEDAHPYFREALAVLGAEAAPRWNFHKYLVAPDGRLVGAWPSRVEPDSTTIREQIKSALPH